MKKKQKTENTCLVSGSSLVRRVNDIEYKRGGQTEISTQFNRHHTTDNTMSFITREYDFGSMNLKSGKKFSAVKGLKKFLKPLMKIIKKQQFTLKTIDDIQSENDFNASLEDMQRENDANELLQKRICDEIEECEEDAAIYVVQGNRRHIVPVEKAQTFVPVNFVRTESGTFFWTSMETIQQQQFYSPRDRWAQA